MNRPSASFEMIQLQGETANDARHNLEVTVVQTGWSITDSRRNGFPARLQRLMENAGGTSMSKS